MKKLKSTKNKSEPAQTEESRASEVLCLLATIEELGQKAGCLLLASNKSLTEDEVLLLEDVQVLGMRAEHLMAQKMRAEASNPDQCVISKSLSRTDIRDHLTLTSVEEKLNELHVLWGQHGQVLQVTDLSDNTQMEFTFVTWSHHKGRRAVLTGSWKMFCRKHGLKVGEEISIATSDQSDKEFILGHGKSKQPLAILQKKVMPYIIGDQDTGKAFTLSITDSEEASSLDNTPNAALFGASAEHLNIECDQKKTRKVTEDEKVIEFADYLFKLSRWGSSRRNRPVS